MYEYQIPLSFAYDNYLSSQHAQYPIVWSRGKGILWEVDKVDSLPSEDYWQVSKAVSGESKIACQHDKVESDTGNGSLHLFEHLHRNEK